MSHAPDETASGRLSVSLDQGTEKPAPGAAPGRLFCIYSLTNSISGKQYIGQTVKARRRWFHHKSALRRKKHWCADLQSDWNSLGWKSFEFIILEENITSKELANKAELKFITRAAQSKGCYNYLIATDDGNGYTVIPIGKIKQSQAIKEAWADPDSGYHFQTVHRWDDPAQRELQSKQMKERYSDPEERRKTAQATKLAQTDEVRRKKSIASKASWADPNSKQRTVTRLPLSDEAKKSKAEKMRAYWDSPEGRAVSAKRADKLRQLWRNPSGKYQQRSK